MGISKIIEGIRNEIRLNKAQTQLRLDEMQKIVERVDETMRGWETPVDSGRSKTRRRPTPVPDRPPVMVAAGIGEDPR